MCEGVPGFALSQDEGQLPARGWTHTTAGLLGWRLGWMKGPHSRSALTGLGPDLQPQKSLAAGSGQRATSPASCFKEASQGLPGSRNLCMTAGVPSRLQFPFPAPGAQSPPAPADRPFPLRLISESGHVWCALLLSAWGVVASVATPHPSSGGVCAPFRSALLNSVLCKLCRRCSEALLEA